MAGAGSSRKIVPEYVAERSSARCGNRRPFRAEARVRRADGEWRWVVVVRGSRASRRRGEFLGHVGLCPDITERKQAEQALQRSEEKFRQLAENIREVFWMMPPAADEMLYVSPAYEQVWGRTCESLYQNPMAWVEAIQPDDREKAHAVFARQIQGRTRRLGVSHPDAGRAGKMDPRPGFSDSR